MSLQTLTSHNDIKESAAEAVAIVDDLDKEEAVKQPEPEVEPETPETPEPVELLAAPPLPTPAKRNSIKRSSTEESSPPATSIANNNTNINKGRSQNGTALAFKIGAFEDSRTNYSSLTKPYLEN